MYVYSDLYVSGYAYIGGCATLETTDICIVDLVLVSEQLRPCLCMYHCLISTSGPTLFGTEWD